MEENPVTTGTELRTRLHAIASNLVWVWRPALRDFLASISPADADFIHNPVAGLQALGDEQLAALDADKAFQKQLVAAEKNLADELAASHERCPEEFRGRVLAYFSAEYGIHQSLPIYSGGLGVLSGDHTKSAHDHGLPLVCVGLFYRQGYFTQRINEHGQQVARMDTLDPARLPVRQVLNADGSPLKLKVDMPEGELVLQLWEVAIGNTRLLLLDSDTEENTWEQRPLTWQLYGGDRDTRIRQEIVLGVGGVRALRALGLTPDVWHMNEGHSAFMAVERVREHLATGMGFVEAVEAVAASTIFTTHTPVSAGNEAFMLPLFHSYFQPWCEHHGMDFHALLDLGTLTEKNGYKFFSLTALAIRLSRFANGVSQLHGDVSRKMWHHLWHQVPIAETPIGHVTNGIHTGTWLSDEFRELFVQHVGADWEQKLENPEAWQVIQDVPDSDIWSRHLSLKTRLYDVIAAGLKRRFEGTGVNWPHMVERLAPASLTIGFARRFATYKRADLLFSDLDRLDRMVNHPEQPVTFIFAGKAHPADLPGQEMIRRIHEVSLMERFHGRVILLEGYDMELAARLVQGVDIWMNNPRRPLEASGTSGEKVPPNGGVNFSILDGWWVEGYSESPRNGWKIGRDKDYGDDRIQDYYDVRSQYQLLEKQIIPLFYKLGEDGLPTGWVDVMKASMQSLVPVYSTQRMLRDYMDLYYGPALRKGLKAQSENWGRVHAFVEWKTRLQAYWYHMTDTFLDAHRDAEKVQFKAGLYLGLLNPADVRVELHQQRNGDTLSIPAVLEGPSGEPGEYVYTLNYRGEHLADSQLRLRVLPNHDYLDHPMEMGMCFWFSKAL